MSNSLRPHGVQHPRLPFPSPVPGACSNSCPSNQWCHPTISSSVVPFSSHLQSFTASGFFPVSQFFTSGRQSIGVSASAWSSLFQWIVRTDFLSDWLVGSPCSPRDSLESSPTSQFKSINSSVFSFLYSPTLTSIHDYWKNQFTKYFLASWSQMHCMFQFIFLIILMINYINHQLIYINYIDVFWIYCGDRN